MLAEREDGALAAQLEPKRNPFVRAMAFMLAAAGLIPLLNAEVKYLGVFYPVIQLLWCRYFGHVAFTRRAKVRRCFALNALGCKSCGRCCSVLPPS